MALSFAKSLTQIFSSTLLESCLNFHILCSSSIVELASSKYAALPAIYTQDAFAPFEILTGDCNMSLSMGMWLIHISFSMSFIHLAQYGLFSIRRVK